MRRPIMTDPKQLRSLEGQQYLVLRPAAEVADDYAVVQDALLKTLSDAVTHPHAAHVTLRGFSEPERLAELRAVVLEWAAAQHPITITAEAIDTFPAPWQIVLVRLARTPSLVAAYASLTRALAGTDFIRLDELSLEDWTFHLSVVYGRKLEPDAWADVERTVRREYSIRPTEILAEAELVSYSGGVENIEVIPLG